MQNKVKTHWFNWKFKISSVSWNEVNKLSVYFSESKFEFGFQSPSEVGDERYAEVFSANDRINIPGTSPGKKSGKWGESFYIVPLP